MHLAAGHTILNKYTIRVHLRKGAIAHLWLAEDLLARRSRLYPKNAGQPDGFPLFPATRAGRCLVLPLHILRQVRGLP